MVFGKQLDFNLALTLDRWLVNSALEHAAQVAVSDGKESLTFAQLNEKSNQVAHFLMKKAGGRASAIGICAENTIERLIVLLGVVKAGGVYVPLDPAYPKSRLQYIAKDADISLVLGEDKNQVLFSGSGIEFIKINNLADESQTFSKDAPILNVNPSDPVHILYTSGSTGKPKGVIGSHQAIVNRFNWTVSEFPFQKNEVCCQKTSINFIPSVWETFGPLVFGVKVVLINSHEVKDVRVFVEKLKQNRITRMILVPSLLDAVLQQLMVTGEKLDSLRLWMTSGERLPRQLVQKFYTIFPDAELVNIYGSTEIEDGCYLSTLRWNQAEAYAPIGYPIANSAVAVVDECGNAIEDAQGGEICFSGPGVARGYKNLKNFADKLILMEGKAFFKTGDYGRIVNGVIEYLGRNDHMFKIRGQRVELGEIEAVINKVEGIKKAIVTFDEKKDFLICFFVADKEKQPAPEYLRNVLLEELPDFMVPVRYLSIKEIPLTPNGKIDRLALPNIRVFSRPLSSAPILPQNLVEKDLAAIFREILSLDEVGIKDNFFELGGDSLKAVSLLTMIEAQFGVRVGMEQFFNNPNIAALSEYLEKIPKKLTAPESFEKDQDALVLSPLQQRLWIQQELLGEQSSVFNLGSSFEIFGEVNSEVLLDALRVVVARHSIFTRKLSSSQNVPMLQKTNILPVEKRVREFSNLSAAKAFLNEYIAQPISVREVLSDFCILQIGASSNHYMVVCKIHHIIFDGWSLGIFAKDLTHSIKMKMIGRTPYFNKPFEFYNAFSARSKNYLESHVIELENFWKGYLKDYSGTLELPTDYQRNRSDILKKGQRISSELPLTLTAQIEQLAHKLKVTPYNVYLGAYYLLLLRYSQQEEIVIGVPLALRDNKTLEQAIGFFVNTIPVRITASKQKSIRALLKQLSDDQLRIYDHSALPFDRILEVSGVPREIGIHPIYQVMFAMQSYDLTLSANDAIQMKWHELDNGGTEVDLTLTIQPSQGISSKEIVVEYDCGLFKAATIERFLAHYINVLQAILMDVDQTLDAVDFIDDVEKQTLLKLHNQTHVEYLSELTLYDLFDRYVLSTPHKVAVEYDDKKLTYQDVDDHVSILVNRLIGVGVRHQDYVGLSIKRSEQLIIAMLAIWKVGGIYLPIDPELPQERVDYILEDTKAEYALVDTDSLHLYQNNKNRINIINLAVGDEEVLQIRDLSIFKTPNPEDVAYVMYTSGSTGNPKGVVISQRSIVDRMFCLLDFYQVDSSCRHFQYGSYSFDTSLEELLLPVFSGGTLIFAPRNLTYDPQEFVDLIEDHQITTLNFIPSLQRVFLDYIELNGLKGTESLKFVISGAERLTPEIVQKFYRCFPEKILFNSYGPTENTINSALHVCTVEDGVARSVPIGKTPTNSTGYVFDEQLRLVPFGVAGELWVGGVGLAVGYLNRPDLTSERFIENPHVTGERLYRTGDKVCMHDDGVIEFIGRNDNQVKVRGYRIELGEVEAAIRELKLIKHAVVLAKTDQNGEVYLAAYFTADVSIKDASEVQAVLRQHLKNKLPIYMIPRAFVLLKDFPLLTSGKVNLKALPEPEVSDTEIVDAVSKSALEQKLFDIWASLLGASAFGIEDNFFYVGGSSIQATRLVNEIKTHFGKNIRLKDFFQNPTIRGLAALLEKMEGKANIVARRYPRREKMPLSSAQERMWFLDRFNGDNTENIIPIIVTFDGLLNIERLKNAAAMLCSRHESLRANFAESGGVPFQFVREEHKLDFVVIENRPVKEVVHQELQRSFDLKTDSLIKFRVVAEDQCHTLIITMHHIIGDGWSTALLLRDLADFYSESKNAATKLDIEFIDYVFAEQELLRNYEVSTYWHQNFSGELPLLQLPIDKMRPRRQTFSGDQIAVAVSQNDLALLKKFASEQRVSLFNIFISAYFALLYLYTRQNDLIVGTVFSNRTDPAHEKVIGFFANTLPIRGMVKDNISFIELLKNNQIQLSEVVEHQNAPFSKLVETFVKDRDVSRNPLFQTLFVMQDTLPDLIRFDNLGIEYPKVPHVRSKFDLSVLVNEHSQGINFTFEYNTDLFFEETISKIANVYISLLMACIKQGNLGIGDLNYLPQHEQALLRQFNQTEHFFDKRHLTLDMLCRNSFEKYPDKIAVVSGDKKCTFKQLDQLSNQLAHDLLASNIQSNELVAVVMEKGWEQVVATFAILKAGAAYLPINAHDPIPRIQELLELGKVKVIFSQSMFTEKLGSLSDQYRVVYIDQPESYVVHAEEAPVIERNPDDLAYVIFTSGSTGKPKGVMIKHSAAVNTILDINYTFNVDNKDVIYGISALNFDLSVYDIFGSLAVGATLVLPKESERKEPAKWVEHIHAYGVSFWNSVPALMQMLCDYVSAYSKSIKLEGIKNVLLSGDWIPLDLPGKIKKYLGSNTRLTSLGGATEASIWSIYYPVEKVQEGWRSIPYGKPMLNQKFYVFNEQLNPLPIGAPGELYIGGVGVAEGYWADPERTAKAFKLHPITGERIYKTGDMGRYFPDGNIEFLGRNDHQVKVRGYRVELGEIQSKVSEIEGIDKVIVLDQRSQHGEIYLVAYVVMLNGYDFEETTLKNTLKEKLPEYMIPNRFIEVSMIPLTANGKIDRSALPSVESEVKSAEYVQPSTDLEKEIAAIWGEVLAIPSISRNSNFFEIGGHSLLAAKVAFAIGEAYSIEIPVNLIFSAPVLVDFASHVEVLISHKKASTAEGVDILEEGEF